MTASDSDPIFLLARALDQAGTIIARVRPDQATMPTPCQSWHVRALVNHVVQDVRQCTARASGQEWEQDDRDVVGDDWAGTYREAADGLLAAWRREGALERMVELPLGEVPAVWQVGQQIADLACTAGTWPRRPVSPPTSTQRSGRWPWTGDVRTKARFRGDEAGGHAFGTEVLVADDAPCTTGWRVLRPRPALSSGSRRLRSPAAMAAGPRRDGRVLCLWNQPRTVPPQGGADATVLTTSRSSRA